MTGKLTRADLDRYVFSRTGAENERVRVGPRFAEDAAAIDIDAGTLVVSTDPISLAAERLGTLAVNVATNDVAASGARPEFLTCTILLPDGDPELVDTVTAQLDEEATRLGVSIVGGHTESVDALSRPLASLTCFGTTDRFVSTGGARPGDRVLLTKGAGIEATGVLSTDFVDQLTTVDQSTLDRAVTAFDDLSVMPEAAVLSPVASAMHDPTEGGVVAGLVELALASDVVLDVDADAIPIREETRQVCAAVDVDPLRALGSGALVATVPEDEVAEALDALAAEGIDTAVVGTVSAVDGAEEPGLRLDGDLVTEVPRDELYALWE